METPRLRWWQEAMHALAEAKDPMQSDAYRAAQAGIANAYLQMVRLTYIEEVNPLDQMPVWTGRED